MELSAGSAFFAALIVLFGGLWIACWIADIKGEGYLIRTDRVKDPRTGKYYASYSLV